MSILHAGRGLEAFLLRRLETLTQTAGRFLMNMKLPIPFDSVGQMEVDFLCASAGLVVELDGAQHLSDLQAYRWDRQKNVFLQERGFFVLRFLVEDLAKDLDAVLDVILRTLAHRARIR
jgi:very-short-patch-repair endonuclease